MEVTIIGWIVIVLTIYCFFRNEEWLLYLGIFFSTFTATSIFNIQKTITGMPPFYFIIAFWILRVMINYFKAGNKIDINQVFKVIKKNKLIKALLIFSIILILGELFMLITGNVINIYDKLNKVSFTLKFSGSNITQPIYILLMIVFSIVLSLKLRSKEKIKKVIIVFIISTLFALVWGIIQFCMFYLNIEYPAYLFNNNIALAQLHYQMVYGIKRVNSIALEPSTFSLNILALLPLIMTLWLANFKIIENKFKSNSLLLGIILITLVCGILTTSSTAYIGIFLTVLLLTIYISFFSIKNGEFRKNKIRLILFYIILLISAFIVMFLVIKVFDVYWGTLFDMFKDMTINKINLESGHERGNAIKITFQIFKQSPILGIGWGSFRSLDLLTNILSSMGILGLLSYFYIIFVVINTALKRRNNDEVVIIGLTLTVVVMSIALLISIPDLIFGYYWMVIVITYNYCSNMEDN
ncbi:O-antigen ligase family protein [Clostridium perfringens]|nr:O-antigen ligase family protein [Clostridium perfringens]